MQLFPAVGVVTAAIHSCHPAELTLETNTVKSPRGTVMHLSSERKKELPSSLAPFLPVVLFTVPLRDVYQVSERFTWTQGLCQQTLHSSLVGLVFDKTA